VHALQHHFEDAWNATEDANSHSWMALLVAYSIIAFCGSFRGPEVFLTDHHGLRKYLNTPPQAKELPHIILPLIGHLKNENDEKYHLMPLCSTTSLGLQL
jgi:hypothetical protein